MEESVRVGMMYGVCGLRMSGREGDCGEGDLSYECILGVLSRLPLRMRGG